MRDLGGRPDQAGAATVPAEPRVAVVLSERLATLGPGLDLGALQQWLEATLPGVHAHVVPAVAHRWDCLAKVVAASGADRLVLGLVNGEDQRGEIQAQARKAGLDALGVAAVTLGAHAGRVRAPSADAERAKLLLAAAVAKARAFRGSGPEHTKVVGSLAVSRRALFALALHEYRTVPAVLAWRCVADRGCRRCVDTCPRSAIRLRGPHVELDKARCEGCGVCASVCPIGAVEFPGFSAGEMDAQIATLLDSRLADLTPRGILFACPPSAVALEMALLDGFSPPPGWLPIAVPCAGAVPLGLVLRCLELGAVAVGLAACGEPCPFGQGAAVGERVAFWRELLERLGVGAERVQLCPVAGADAATWLLPDAAVRRGPSTEHGLSEHRGGGSQGTAAALLTLARAHDAPDDLLIEHADAPFGIVEIDATGCTACEACTEACPTGALARDHSAGAVKISFDPALCPACGLCVPRCPEGDRDVLRLRRGVDVRRLAAGRVTLFDDETRRCTACGAPIAPEALMARVAALLGAEHGALAPVITRYCHDCRGLAALAGVPDARSSAR